MDPWLLSAAGKQSERVAVATPERSLRYSELAKLAAGVAAHLQADGIVAGQRVALEIEDRMEFLVALHGCLLAGAPAVPVDLRLSEAEREVRRIGSVAVLRETPRSGGAGAAGTVSEDAVATVMHTSGTTSAPRAVALTYSNWQANALGSAVALGLDRQERWLCAMPLTHVGGLSIPIRSAIYATTAVVHGRLEITGRRADTIVTGGENVAPAEVEAILLEHPAVADAGVFGRLDSDWGEAVSAAIVLCDGTTVAPDELRAFCAERLPAFKV